MSTIGLLKMTHENLKGIKVVSNKDGRPYVVITVARSRNKRSEDFMIENVIISPLDGDYGNYCIPFGEFKSEYTIIKE